MFNLSEGTLHSGGVHLQRLRKSLNTKANVEKLKTHSEKAQSAMVIKAQQPPLNGEAL